jgi:hypothetical protein
VGSWRELQHPDLSPFITHFTSRGRGPGPEVPTWISSMEPEDKLKSILQRCQFLATRPYGSPLPAVCGTEATTAGLAHLISERGYGPWALVLHKEAVYELGGGPVWYARDDEYALARSSLPPSLACRLVRYEPGIADWTHEREWRIPVSSEDGWLCLRREAIRALIVGNQNWPPEEEDERYQILELGWPVMGPPDWIEGLERWWWNPVARSFYALS